MNTLAQNLLLSPSARNQASLEKLAINQSGYLPWSD